MRVRDLLESLPDPGDGFSRLERTQTALQLRAANGRDGAGAPFWELSKREIDVLRLLPCHLSRREMAAELYVSLNTVRTHTGVLFRKLGVTSRAEAVARARARSAVVLALGARPSHSGDRLDPGSSAQPSAYARGSRFAPC
jgi:DNA-binding CsgD family transcriptional regulator